MNDRLPVIVGVGESIDRLESLENSKGPLDLIAEAVANAERDAGVPLAEITDQIDVVKHTSVSYDDLAALVKLRLRAGKATSTLSDGSGNGPLREMHNAALRIQRGEIQVALLTGSEAQRSVDHARKQGIRLPWMGKQEAGPVFRAQSYANPLAVKYGLEIPFQIYPLYENATAPLWGQTPQQARDESARIWANMSEVAARNACASARKPLTPREVAEQTANNRPLAWPYLKFMVAQPSVNVGAAIFLTSVGHARKLGIAEDRMVFLHGGAAAREPDDYLVRDSYGVNASQTTVLQTVLAQMGWDRSRFELVDLYSCFPVVPKMARRLLGIAEDGGLTIAGGLSFFGAPVHNYMSHAAAATVRQLRAARDGHALLYGQGGNVTKHHALVLSGRAPESLLPESFSVQAKADAARGPVPPLTDAYTGPATLETFTVMHDRHGEPTNGVVLVITPAGERALANVPASDTRTIAHLKSLARSPIGDTVQLRPGSAGLTECTVP
ncbi:hypothetical protein [Ramlibacter sp.]|uniref:hypothetical protein n=1 Tax=Ramlibacter sp. TaxID=1917967 RepID=UPI003D12805B